MVDILLILQVIVGPSDGSACCRGEVENPEGALPAGCGGSGKEPGLRCFEGLGLRGYSDYGPW